VSTDRQLDDLLDAGRQMLAVAQAGDWARANELQADCQCRATALFAEPVSATDAATFASGISQLMDMHAEVMRLCVAARDDSLQEIDSLNHGRQAVSKYSANSG
jgi:hypothetical protein